VSMARPGRGDLLFEDRCRSSGAFTLSTSLIAVKVVRSRPAKRTEHNAVMVVVMFRIARAVVAA